MEHLPLVIGAAIGIAVYAALHQDWAGVVGACVGGAVVGAVLWFMG